jgi:predicted RNA binding protein YcfA (HicA-like mRNA interferase family)
MPPLRLTGTQLSGLLMRAGFDVVRVRGSHHLLRHADGRTTVVPVHSGEIIGPGLLEEILREARMTHEDLAGLVHRHGVG